MPDGVIGRAAGVLALVILAVLAAACSGAGAGPGAASTTPGSTEAPLKVDAATLQSLRQPTKKFQLSLVQHGELSFAAYDRLAHAYMQCIGDAGASLADNWLAAGGSYFFTVYTPPDPSGKVTAAVTACTDQFYDPLMPAWSLEHQPSPAVIQEANAALASCLRGQGFQIDSPHPGAQDFQRLFSIAGHPDSRFFACSQKVSDQFKLPAFGGG